MDAKHRRLAFTTKTNNKKRTDFNFFSSNQIFYLAFPLSILLHVGVLYSIPAVDLFSNSATADNEKLIVLDLLDDQTLPPGDDSALSEEQEHQFQAAVPEIPWNWSEDAREQAPDAETDIDDMEFAPLPDITELKDDYTLVSEAREQTPDLPDALLKKSAAEELMARPFKPRQPDIKQPAAEEIRPTPPETTPEERIPSPVPLARDALASQKPESENVPTFPRRLPDLEKRQKPRLAEKPLTRPVLDKRQAQDLNLQDAPKLSALRRDDAELQKRRLGLAKDDDQDRNRFGIFAGEKFEAPQFQDTETVSEIDKHEPDAPDDVTQKAESLQTDTEIEGPIRGRAIVYRPNPPKIDSMNIEVELRLKFWVLPDGTIGEVIPIKRGNAQLEQIAISYLKKWQFEALSASESQAKIWGTIPIKFTAQ